MEPEDLSALFGEGSKRWGRAGPHAPSRADVQEAKYVIGHLPCSFEPVQATRLRRLDFVDLHLSWLRILVDDSPHYPGLYLLLVDVVEFVFLATQVKVSFAF